MTTARIGFTGDDLPANHALFDFDGEFWIAANVTPGCEARINCDPDDGWPAEADEIEILSVTLRGTGRAVNGHASILEAAFLDLIDSDKKLRDRVREEIGEAYSESRLCRMGD